MALYQITMRLGRNPDAGFPEGDDRYGYVVTAPLNAEGFLDGEEWSQKWRDCTVTHFTPDRGERRTGRLRHKGERWFFDYQEDAEEDDELLYRLGDHRLRHGDYVTIHEDGEALTYVVSAERLLPGQ